MKKSTVFITTFILLAAFIAFSIFYAKIYKPAHTDKESSTLYVADSMASEKTGNRILLAELAEEDFHLYQDGGYTILVHNGQEAEFSDWSKMIAEEPPKLYYFDFNENGEKELVVRALEGIDEKTKEKYYCVYVLFITEDENGNYKYEVTFANGSTWYATFERAIKYETNQPTLNAKRIQYVMNHSGLSISYDKNTGIVQDSRAWYVKALSDGKNNYYTLKDWYLGPAVLDVDTEEKCLRIHMNFYALYNETDEIQIGGKLNCGLSLKGREFDVTNKSVNFATEPEYRVTSLLKLAEEDWSYTFKNQETSAASGRTINKTSFKCTMQNGVTEENTVFSGTTEQAKAIERIVLTQNTMKLYAASGCSFSADVINSLKYSVLVKVGGVDADITISANVGEENGRSVLTFNLDKPYPQTELKEFTVTIG